MIKTLRRRFIRTAMLAVTLLLVLLLGAINLVNFLMSRSDLEDTLRMLSDRVGKDEQQIVNTAYFVVSYDTTGEVVRVDVSHIADLTEDEAKELAAEVYADYVEKGYIIVPTPSDAIEESFPVNGDTGEGIFMEGQMPAGGQLEEPSSTDDAALPREIPNAEIPQSQLQDQNLLEEKNRPTPGESYFGSRQGYLFLAHTPQAGAGTEIVFLSTGQEWTSLLRVLVLSIAIGAICWLGMLLLVTALSRKAIDPIAENIERQKRFVTDAGHELKTPLAIILSNTEALELYQGESKYSKNIREQVKRLDGLTKNLLLLSRMDEPEAMAVSKELISISELVQQTAEQFVEPFALRGIRMQQEIAPNLSAWGNREQLQQLLNILLENALKYTSDHGELILKLQREDGKRERVAFTAENTCDTMPQVPAEKLFDRFTRGSESRNQKAGGYGIGLSAARAIAEAHDGSISATYVGEKRIRFVVKLPLSK